MSDEAKLSSADKEEQKRDEILRRLLKTPPQPRPKRERGESISPKGENEKEAPEE